MLEAAAEFRAPDPKEKAIPLHGAHHEHVNTALTRFKEQATSEALGTQTVEYTPSPNERRALTCLDTFLSLSFVSDEEKHLIQAGKLALRRARFQNLQRQINQLQRSVKNVHVAPAVQADQLVALLRAYPLLEQVEKPAATVNPRLLDTPPDIVLTESFDHPLCAS